MSNGVIRFRILTSREKITNQVVADGKEHQEDDENEADLLGDLHLPEADGLSQNRF